MSFEAAEVRLWNKRHCNVLAGDEDEVSTQKQKYTGFFGIKVNGNSSSTGVSKSACYTEEGVFYSSEQSCQKVGTHLQVQDEW